MSQHGCPERLSNRSKGFGDEGGSQPTMEVLVETLTGTAFEMTVSPSDTIFAIKSKIYRVEGIPVSQQHLLYNLKELEDSSSLEQLSISDGARLRLVLGMRGGPVSTRRLPAPPEPWRDIERLLETNRDEGEWSGGGGGGGGGGAGCKVTVLVFRDGERVNMLRVRENNDGTYSPLDQNKYGGCVERAQTPPMPPPLPARDNAVTLGKMIELRRRMDALQLHRQPRPHDKVEIQKTRSEETLSVQSLLDDRPEHFHHRAYTPFSEEDNFSPLYDGNYTRYDYDCSFSDRYSLLPPIGTRAKSDQSVSQDTDKLDSGRFKINSDRFKSDRFLDSDRYKNTSDSFKVESEVNLDGLSGSILVQGRESAEEDALLQECVSGGTAQSTLADTHVATKSHASSSTSEYMLGGWWCGGWSLSASTSELDVVRARPGLARHSTRPLLAPRPAPLVAPPAAPLAAPLAATLVAPLVAPPPRPTKRLRCLWCRKRLSVSTVHRCRCGGSYCAPHRYKEVHGCTYDYKADAEPRLTLVAAPKLPKI